MPSVEATTRDGAIAAAREKYGSSARVVAVRKTRSGGVMGFFASERYIAEVEEVQPRRREPAPLSDSRRRIEAALSRDDRFDDDAPATPARREPAARHAAARPVTARAAALDPVDELAGLLGHGGGEAPEVGTYSRAGFSRAAAANRPGAAPAAAPATWSTPAAAPRTPAAARTGAAPTARAAAPQRSRAGAAARPPATPLTDDVPLDEPAGPSLFTAALAQVVSDDSEVRAAVEEAVATAAPHLRPGPAAAGSPASGRGAAPARPRRKPGAPSAGSAPAAGAGLAAALAAVERAAADRAVAERVAAERAEATRMAAEQEAARIAARREATRLARQRAAAEQAAAEEAARLAAEQAAAEEAARLAAEQAAAEEAARLAAEQATAEEAARLAAAEEAARLAAEQEAARLAAEQEAARLAAEQAAAEAARIAAEQEAARRAAEEAAAAESARVAAEQEAARIAAAQAAEAARIAAERQAAEHEAARRAAEQAAAAESARVAAEQEAARAAAAQAAEATRIAAERQAARLAAEREAARMLAEQAVAAESARVAAEREAFRTAEPITVEFAIPMEDAGVPAWLSEPVLDGPASVREEAVAEVLRAALAHDTSEDLLTDILRGVLSNASQRPALGAGTGEQQTWVDGAAEADEWEVVADVLAPTASDPAPLPMDATAILPPLSLLPPRSPGSQLAIPPLLGGRPPVPPPRRRPAVPEQSVARVASSRAPQGLATVTPLPVPRAGAWQGGSPVVVTSVRERSGGLVPAGGMVDPRMIEAVGVVNRLRALGLPEALLGGGFAADIAATGTYAALTRVLAKLPAAPSVPSGPGEVLLVVGPGAETLAAARSLAAGLRLDSDRLQWASRGDLANLVPHASRIASVDTALERKQEAAQAGEMTVVAVDAPLRSGGRTWLEQMLAIWAPSAVWAVVEATRKADDLGPWLEALPRVDALMVQDTDLTADPAAVLARAAAPVALLDGARATAHRWASLLCERLEAGEA
ncbi:hypothetical protein [Trujillonella endophytica]|uniref:hypothetical protein n=1 Tax=Trujillonella endophytica TaxID=673521 RepID=UPI00147A4ADE|nr:hypothetical protein [Trujillella endophytica]